ncbi:hypothetical protein P1A20_14065 [Staphylococcus equorum]|uniref:hypothetical protein n=1 Tax=Staphylococcus equorum TaxID=246432 RepID=UPI0025574925|nr:hypothetical protein [Staphylococcus equorum]MDK9847701.1 hypothetical protein [Staphylococcus equorum]
MSEKRVTVKIGKEQFDKIQKERELTKVPQIHIINEAIDQYLSQHNISIVETEVKKSNCPILVGYCNPSDRFLSRVEFNIYIDKEEKIIHLYDPLNNHTTSLINKVNESFVKELCKSLNLNVNEYEIYIYTIPVHSENPFTRAYNYENNQFYNLDDKKMFTYFYEQAKNELGRI